ncbi:ComEA family DNA-binding protein [Fodinibius sp.]
MARERNGPFTNIEQLKNIRGIGPRTMDKLRPNVVVE